ncbi:hypothetical protein PHYBOEH_000739 [Phytophthora boehmeriae]|uniref:Helicase ATP-binding domain-containing protein n=1 Tax=Phytophthora boehmeriae TaxID=109152 RepID=A0A8T1X137_9STRA|nr:hypothetical protein PHYBOEH_000739 [Phytophthora boehmeriae]
MGVRGLTRYCHQNETRTSCVVSDLKDVTLAVDFVGFLYYLCEQLYQDVQSEGRSAPTWLLLGGCPLRLERWVETWLKRLRSRNVRLTFITDPPQCFGGVEHRKGYCLADRALQKSEQIQQLTQSLVATLGETKSNLTNDKQEELSPTSLQRQRVAKTLLLTNGRFPFAREKLRGVLKKHGISIKTAEREADEELGNLVRSGAAYAVLAEDSDFLCMSGVKYIPFKKLSLQKDKDSGQLRLSARVFSSEMVAESLGLEVKQLVDLAILCGNDFTPLLDTEFNMAANLSFPVQRLQAPSSLSPLNAAAWASEHLPTLENPMLSQIEVKHKGFLRALFEIYRFYGHADAFLKKFPMTIKPMIPIKKLKLYKRLLDHFDFPPMAIDILETKSRGLTQRFDPLPAVPGLQDKTLDDFQAPSRHLSYLVLDAPAVEEITFDKRFVVHAKQFDLVAPLLPYPVQGRSAKTVNQTFNSLVFCLLYGNSKGGGSKANQLSSMLGKTDKKGLAVKTIVFSLLVLWKRDRTYLAKSSLLNDRMLEILLLTSLMSLAMDSSKKKAAPLKPIKFDEQLLNMEVYATVGGYLETMKQLHQLRLVLGNKLPQSSGCAAMFSGEVFIQVCHVLIQRNVEVNVTTKKSAKSSPRFSKNEVESVVHSFGANTVAKMREGNEFGEDGKVGNAIGYRIGQKQVTSSKTKITYVTTGYMVERIIHDPDALRAMTHLVLDEVHERSMDVDLLLLLLKLQLKVHSHLRLVIMSATMDAQVLMKYLGKALSTRLVDRKPLFVGSKLFPVKNVYLDELSQMFPNLWRRCKKEMITTKDQFQLLSQSRLSASSQMAKKAISKIHEKQLVMVEEMRSGRAGRVMPGTAFHLFTEAFRDLCMAEYNTPELLRKPLDRIVLQLKGRLNQFGVPSALLRQALDAPDLSHIDGAYKLLAHFDAIDSEDEEGSRLTKFGSFICHLPLSLELCRLLMTGAYMDQDNVKGCESWPLLLKVVILVAILAVPDLFVMPSFYHAHSAHTYLKEMKKNLQSKLKLDDGMWSEPLAIWLFYIQTMSQQSLHGKRNLTGVFHKMSISARRYQTLNFLISDLCARLISLSKDKNGDFEQFLDAKTVVMLSKLEGYASSQRMDKQLLQFARHTVTKKHEGLRILRFLIIQNYGEHLIGTSRPKPSNFVGDDLGDTDRVDLKVDKEDSKVFFSLSDKDKAKLFSQISSSTNPMDELATLAYQKPIVSIYSYTMPKNQEEVDGEDHSNEIFKTAVSRMSFPVSFIYYIRGEKFPVNLGMQLNSEERELAFKFRVSGSNSSGLTWLQQKDNVKASTGSRSLFSLPIRPLKVKKGKGTKLMAVYTDRLFTGDETKMFCTNCTLLPPNILGYYPIMLLLTAPRHANIQLHMDGTAGEILLVKVGAQDAAFPRKTALRVEALATINAVRAALSDALNAAQGAKRISVSDLLALSEDSIFVTKESKADASRCKWHRLAILDTKMLKAGETPSRFPELCLI